ncbi:hypothetical protein KFK09_001675 [Dendrobium nobile]|uniref:DUF4283 domain-containing protein n=1 Tax=Dendrobium nobile TaxID=94219 RepID=A0A8T3C836_DENNO|nr:hypothetical protein KFK09_001675 [Dendrobium nobile]
MAVPDRRQWLAGGNPPTEPNRNVPLRADDQKFVKNRNVSLDQEPFRVVGTRWSSDVVLKVKQCMELNKQEKQDQVHKNLSEVIDQDRGNLEEAMKRDGESVPVNKRQWGNLGSFHITTLGCNWMLCSFTTMESMEEVLGGGPWYIGNHIIGMDRWSSSFSIDSLKGISSPVWIRFPGLPLSCWDEENIPMIASMIGTPLMLDGNSFKWGKREYARCLEVLKRTENVNEDGFKQQVDDYGPWIHVKFRDRRVRNIKRAGGASSFIKQIFRPDIPIGLNKFQALEGDLEEGELNEKEKTRMLEKAEPLNQYGKEVHLEVEVPNADHCLEDQLNSTSTFGKVKLAKELRSLGPMEADTKKRRGTKINSGILVMWKKDTASFEVLNHSSQLIMGILSVNNMGIIGGDFNCILSKEDKRGGKSFNLSNGTKDMKMFLMNNDFHDIGYVGPNCTWCNNKEGTSRIWERLDRCLLNSTALQSIPMAKVRHLPRVASEHAPIAINLVEPQKQNFAVIRFEDTWKSYPVTWNIISKTWKKMDFGTNAEILQRKLRRSLKALYYWNKNKCKELNSFKEELKKEILQLQIEETRNGGLTDDKLKSLRSKVHDHNVTLKRLATW